MKHILNNLSEEEKNAIREQHTGGMKVMTENFSKLINSKLGDSKPLVNEQTSDQVVNVVAGGVAGGVGGIIASADLIVNGAGTSDQKVKSLCALCKKTKAPITQMGNRLADDIRDSVQGMGTNEKTINNVFAGLRSFNDFCSLVNAYQSSYSTDLYSDLDADIDSESEWVTIFRPIRNLLLKQQQQQKLTPTSTRPPVPKPLVREQSMKDIATAGQAITNTTQTKPTINKTVTLKIDLDCNKKLIVKGQLPKLSTDANLAIINYFCQGNNTQTPPSTTRPGQGPNMSRTQTPPSTTRPGQGPNMSNTQTPPSTTRPGQGPNMSNIPSI